MTKQYPLPLPHREAMAASDFLVTESNAESRNWIDLWPKWPSHCLIITGPPGSGKSHLLSMWRDKSGARNVDPQQGLDDPSLREAKSIAIDNVDRRLQSFVDEEFLFHLFNGLKDKGGSLLLTAKDAPAHWDLKLPDLRSRLVASPTVQLAPPDDDLLVGLLIKQFEDRQLDIGDGIVDYIIPRIERTPKAVRELVDQLDRLSLAAGKKISLSLVRQILAT